MKCMARLLIATLLLAVVGSGCEHPHPRPGRPIAPRDMAHAVIEAVAAHITAPKE